MITGIIEQKHSSHFIERIGRFNWHLSSLLLFGRGVLSTGSGTFAKICLFAFDEL